MINLNEKKFSCFISSAFLSTLADILFSTFLAWYVADVLKSGTLMGIILLVLGIMRITFSIFSGVFVDQYGPKKIIMISDILRSIIVIIIWCSFLYFPSQYILFLVCLFGIVDAFHWPSLESMKAQLFDKEKLLKLNSIYYTLLRGANILSPLLAAYLMSITNYEIAFILTAILFLLSSLFVSVIRMKAFKNSTSSTEKSSFKADFLEGYRYILLNPKLKMLVFLIALVNLSANGIFVTLPYLVKELHFQVTAMGVFSTSMAIGSLIAGFFTAFAKIKKASINLIALGFIAQGLFITLIPFSSNYVFISFSFFGVGVATAFSSILISVFLQTNVPQEKMGRIGGLLMTISMSTTPLAQFCFGILIDHFKVNLLYYFSGCYEILISLIIVSYYNAMKQQLKNNQQQISKVEQL
jgi:MFS family permease